VNDALHELAAVPRLRVHALVDTLGSGGAEFLLADFAAVAAAAGIDLSVAAIEPLDPPSAAADRLRRNGLEPETVGTRRMVGRKAFRRMRAHLLRHDPDIVHTHLGTADVLGGIAAWSLRIPSVTTIHADTWLPQSQREHLKAWLTTRVRRHCAETVIAVSDSARRAYLTQGRDVPSHVTVVRNGIVDRAASGSGMRVRGELGLTPDNLVIATASVLRAEKNLETAIDALALLLDRFPQARLVIAGDGPHEDVIRNHAARLEEAVILAGHRDDVMEVLDSADVLIHPSHFDAFPTTVLEAMAASVPVVATGVGGMVEIVESHTTGILVAPPPSAEAFAGALAPLLADTSLRRRLGTAGRRRYEREFGAEPWAQRTRAVYDRILSTRQARPRRAADLSASTGTR